MITQIPNGGLTFGGPYTQRSSSSNLSHVQYSSQGPYPNSGPIQLPYPSSQVPMVFPS